MVFYFMTDGSDTTLRISESLTSEICWSLGDGDLILV